MYKITHTHHTRVGAWMEKEREKKGERGREQERGVRSFHEPLMRK